MITAVDTNILVDVLQKVTSYSGQSSEWIDTAQIMGSVVICEVVYAELVPNFNSRYELDEALAGLDVELSPINADIAYEAGLRWKRYRETGGPRTRMIADFLIGAHAVVAADAFLTRDRGFYVSYFPELAEPS